MSEELFLANQPAAPTVQMELVDLIWPAVFSLLLLTFASPLLALLAAMLLLYRLLPRLKPRQLEAATDLSRYPTRTTVVARGWLAMPVASC